LKFFPFVFFKEKTKTQKENEKREAIERKDLSL